MIENRISLIITVKNEKKINILLDSILNQSRIPDEIIVVDGGSTDNTISIINQYMDILPIKLFKEKVNVPRGRNIAIENSKYSIIAVTDGGCKLDPNWVAEITKPIVEKNVDIVSGKYVGHGDSYFQLVVSLLLIYDFEKVNENTFSPSSRSIAFKKEAWKQVKGYPEWIGVAEDTYFNRELRKIGKEFYLNRNAIVYWEVRDTPLKLFKQYLNYTTYDVFSSLNIGFYLLKFLFWSFFFVIIFMSIIFKNYSFIFLLFIFIFTLISSRVVLKLKNKGLNLKNFIYGLFIYFICELSQLIGIIFGLFKKIIK